MRKDMEKAAGFFVAICAVWCLSISSLFAEGIVNKQQQSAEYLRTLGRNAATDYADIAVYNPAGIAKMENDGFYVKADLLYFDREYTNDVPDGFGSFAGANLRRIRSGRRGLHSRFFLHLQTGKVGRIFRNDNSGGRRANWILRMAMRGWSGLPTKSRRPVQCGVGGPTAFLPHFITTDSTA